MIQFLKTHGLKVCLPVLLLTTACGEDTSSAQQADVATVSSEAVAAAAQPSAGFGTPNVESANLNAPEIAINLDTDTPSIDDVLPPVTSEEGATDGEIMSEAISSANEPTKIPEPATLAGLAIAAAGLSVVKRKKAV